MGQCDLQTDSIMLSIFSVASRGQITDSRVIVRSLCQKVSLIRTVFT